jgi:deoxyribodipyrimidine photo-lyase
MPDYRTGLFLFRRDLRLDDNTGLREALKCCRRVIPAFVFDPRQQPDANDYFSPPAFQFLLESLEGLAGQLEERGSRLYLFRGLPHEVVGRLLDGQRDAPGDDLGLDAVFVNRDYTPFSRRRDEELGNACRRRGAAFVSVADLLLTEPEAVSTGSGDPYKVFTPFWRRARELGVAKPRRLPAGATFFRGELPGAAAGSSESGSWTAGAEGLPPASVSASVGNRAAAGFRDPGSEPTHPGKHLGKPHVQGGRRRALEILGRLEDFRRYPEERDLPALDGTTSLSAHHKFGTVSVRETHAALTSALGAHAAPLVRQLYWRDFFTHLGFHFPHVFGKAFKPEYDAVAWDDDEERFTAWARGETGFPIVDAGMRQLRESGWMHNRVRMIAASFLTKDLHLDWRLGERFFARHLVDYDPSVNNGNWQWAASTGADAQPYFRIFNPWSQQKKFDPDGEYIRRWVPELAEVEARDLHRLAEQRPLAGGGYPPPIVDHAHEREVALERFQAIR